MKKVKDAMWYWLSVLWIDISIWWSYNGRVACALTVVCIFGGGMCYLPYAITNNVYGIGEPIGEPVQTGWGMIERLYAEEYPKAYQQEWARMTVRVLVRGKIVKVDHFSKTRECREPRYELHIVVDGTPRTEVFNIRINESYQFRELPAKR